MSSFKKRGQKRRVVAQLPLGTRLSIQNGQLLTSSGQEDLDALCGGGGLAVGTLCVLESDENTAHARDLLRYFAVEALQSDQTSESESSSSKVKSKELGDHQALLIVSGERDPRELLYSLPAPYERTRKSRGGASRSKRVESDGRMKIAWRYEQDVDQSRGRTYCGSYDLSARWQRDVVERLATCDDDVQLCDAFDGDLQRVLARIADVLAAARAQKPPKVARIVVEHFGSPAWLSPSRDATPREQQRRLFRFADALRSLLRASTGICMLEFDAHLHPPSMATRLRHAADVAVGIRSFAGSGDVVSEIFQDYTGMFYIHKLPRLNALRCIMPENPTYVYTRKRRRLAIESIHLPPETSRSTKKMSADELSNASSSSSSSSHQPIDASVIDF
jgi:PAXNEB protein